MLAGERQELAASLKNLGTALGEVKTFVKDNKKLLSTNIKGLNRVSKTLVKRRGELDEILHVAPLALNNLALTYNPQAGTLDTAANIGNLGREITNDPALRALLDRRPDRPVGYLVRGHRADPAAGRHVRRRGTTVDPTFARCWRWRDEVAPDRAGAGRSRCCSAPATSPSTTCRSPAAPTSARTRSRSP